MLRILPDHNVEITVMPVQRDHDEDWEDESAWEEDDDDNYTVPCPYCKRPIYEDAERCPYCEHYLSEEDAPPARKPWWIIAGAVICLYVVYRWVAG